MKQKLPNVEASNKQLEMINRKQIKLLTISKEIRDEYLRQTYNPPSGECKEIRDEYLTQPYNPPSGEYLRQAYINNPPSGECKKEKQKSVTKPKGSKYKSKIKEQK